MLPPKYMGNIKKRWDDVLEFYYTHPGFQRHKRLKVFWLKGTKCVLCGLEGNKIIKYRTKRGGGIHYDLFYWTKKRKVLMTVDHWTPKSLGGTRDIDNLEPMCERCNARKANAILL